MTVYIPTMQRHDNLRRIVPRWLEQGMPVTLVVDAEEHRDHISLIREMGWSRKNVTVASPIRSIGIGNARRFCVWHARTRADYKAIIMSDDDMQPSRDSDMRLLLDSARHQDVLGIGAVRSIHDRFTNGAVSRNSGPILCPGGWGFQLFGINVHTALNIGNFDAALHTCGEDAELARKGITQGIPWLVHCDVKCEAIGKRYDPGGIGARFASRDDRTASERECLEIIHQRWPQYTNHPDRPLRVRWQKMLDDHIPGWRARSALHGGYL